MDSEQDTPGSDKLLRWPLRKKENTKYTDCTKDTTHIIKAT